MDTPPVRRRYQRWAPFYSCIRAIAWALPLFLILLPILSPGFRAALVPPRVLIVGGGPDLSHNQAGIESNVRYMTRLLPPGSSLTVLFADGDSHHATVQYEPSTGPATAQPVHNSPGEDAFELLFEDDDDTAQLRYRRPNLPQIDGPAQRRGISTFFDGLKDSNRPVFLYFTGHGSQNDGPYPADTEFDLWGDQPLTVQGLAAELKKVPQDVPISLVMVQCFSGGFANVLFDGGEPDGDLLDRDFAGFFAATPERMSAGCTPTVDESEYKDFTSYFIAALTGQDRMGRRITGADYNHDGRVGMDEAYAYSLVADESIDVPTCTSELFLRRYVQANNDETFKTPYTSVLEWATPAQKAALEGLSPLLNLSGENRLAAAYQDFTRIFGSGGSTNEGSDRFDRLQESYRDALIHRWPALKQPASKGYASAREKAVHQLDEMDRTGQLKDLYQAADDDSGGDGPEYSLHSSRMLRFVRLAKSVVLAHRLEQSDNANLLAKWKRLLHAESRTPWDTASLTSQRP